MTVGHSHTFRLAGQSLNSYVAYTYTIDHHHLSLSYSVLSPLPLAWITCANVVVLGTRSYPHVLLITLPGEIWMSYKHDPRGRKAPEGECLSSAISRLEVLQLIHFPLLGVALESPQL